MASTSLGRPAVRTVPRVPRALLGRPGLVERIAVALADDRPVVVHGPTGAGKSVLVAEWAATTEDRVAHLVLDAALDDRDAFWQAVAAALDDVDALTAISPLRGIRSERGGFRQALLRGLAGTVGRPVLVIDDAHLVQTVGIRDDLVAVLALPGAPLRVVLVGRTTGHRDLADVATAEPVRIGPDDLRLDTGQAAALVGAIIGMPAPVAVLARPLEVLAGHACTIAATARSNSDRTVRRAVVDQDLRRFVSRTAVVPALPLPLVALLGEVRQPGPMLDRVAAHGLGGYAVDDDGEPEFRYAPAVVAAVRASATTDRPMERRTLLRRVALRAVDRPLLAVEAAVELVDLDLLTDVLVASWSRIVGPLAVAAAALLGRLSVHHAAEHPVVLAAIARVSAAAGEHHARASGAHAATIGAVARTIDAAERPQVVFLRALEAQARRIVGDAAGASAASVAAEALLDDLDPLETAEIRPVLPFVLHQIASAAFGDGDMERALRAFARIEAVTDDDVAGQRAHALSAGALVHGLLGEVGTARRMIDAAGECDLPTATLTRAVLALEDFAPERALALLSVVDPLFGAFEHWPIVLTLRARAAIVLGRVSAADYLAEFDAQADRLRLRAPATGTAAVLLGLARARLLLAAGQLARAAAEIDALGVDEVRAAPERASLALVGDDPAGALDIVAAALATSPFWARASSLLVLVRSGAELRIGRVEDARSGFVAVVDLLERTGLRSVLLEFPREDAEALVADASLHGDDRAARMFEPARRLRSALPDSADTVVLSERESVVLGLLAGSRSLAAIATELHVSVNTVKTQTRSIYRKLGVGGRREAVESAHARGLVTPPA